MMEIGFDGKYLDFSIAFGGVGAGITLKNWKLAVAFDTPQYPGVDFSIDPIRLAEDIVNAFIP